MKRVVKSFFIFLLLFAVVNVNALNIGDQFSVSIRQGSTKHSSSYQFNQYYQLESATGGGKTYDAYCMDRGNDPSGGRYVGRLLNKHKGDYAVLYILNNGSSDEEIHLAIRTLVSKGILNWGSTANATADYLAEINAKVNCMKSDSTFNSVLTEFLSNSSKKNSDNDKNADEGGKSLALLGFDKINLLENKCYSNAAECADATGQGCYKNAEGCFVSTGTSCDKTSNVFECYDGRYQNNTSGKFGCKIIKRCTFSSAAACSDNANLHCKYDSTEKAWVQLNGSSCKSCDKYSSERENDGCRKCDTSNSNGSNNNNCDTAQKLQRSLDNCKNEASKMEQQSFNTKKYTCKQDNTTKCFYVAEDTSGNTNNKCNASGEYTKDQCDGMKKTNNSGSCESVGNGCYKYVADSNNGGNGSGGNGGSGGGTSVSCGGFDGIKQLLIEAMNYANEKFGNDGGESKVEKGPATEPEKADGVIKKIVSVKIDIKNITDTSSDSEYFKYLGFEVEKENEGTEVKLLGASKEFINTEDGWESISEGSDLSKLLEERNGTIYVGFLVSRPSSDDSQEVTDDYTEEEDCEVKIKFKYEYTNGDSGAVLYGYNSDSQRYFIATEGEPIQDEFELDTSLCDETTCDPTSTLPNICEDGEEPDENGNVEYEFREAYNAESGKYNIKKCLLSKNSKDKAENPYKLVDNEYADMVADNAYCEVKCKEDYIFGVPYKRSTESGRYFQISVSLKGQQDCYTTKLDYKKYTEDVVKKQKEILDTYNEWLENYENYKQYQWTQSKPMECTNETCNSRYYTDANGNQTFAGCSNIPSIYDYYYNVVHSDKYQYATITEGEDKWTIDVSTGSISPTQFGKFVNGKTCSSSGNSCSTSGECKVEKTAQQDWEDQKSKFESAAQGAKQTLKTLLEDLRQIVDKYNSCAADHDYSSKQNDKSQAYGEIAFWDMIYRYNPDVQYSYEEPEPGISSTRWISSVQGASCEHGMNCDFMYSPDALVNAEKCADTTGGKVTCSESTSIQDIDDDTHVSTWYCDGDIDNEYEQCKGSTTLDYDDEYHWMVLDEDLDTGIEGIVHIGNNLDNSLHKITKIDYVHKIASSKGTYKTERVYYTGHDDGDVKIEATPEHEITNYDIVDGLPVGINTPTGTYYYKLTLNNFGTFYSNVSENGRIFSNLSNSLSSVIRENVTTKNNDEVNSNEYACTYEVNQNTCTDASGNNHYKTECEANEDWDKCQERLCPVNDGGPYCVEKSQSYYVCSTTHYDESCQQKGSREEALLAVGCQPGEACENNFNCCPNCTVKCIGVCSVTPEGGKDNANKPNYDFRPVSPGNLFPNNRTIGYNWESDPSVYKNSLVARKAKDTIEEITARANDTSSEEEPDSTGSTKVENYSLKVVMDTNMINKIREYNKSQESYNNDTMTCYDYQLDRDEEGCKKAGYTWKKDGDSGKCVMANIFCYSSFVDELIDGNFGGEVDVKNKEGRTKAKEQFSKPYVGYTKNNDNLIVTNDYWTIYTFSSLDVNGDGIPDVGPSWK